MESDPVNPGGQPAVGTPLWLDRELPSYDAPFQDGVVDVLVVGGGLAGLATAARIAAAGRGVCVVEARTLAAATTGRSSAKISLLQGAKLSRLHYLQGPAVASSYLEGQRAGARWLIDFCAEHGVAHQRRDAVTFAIDEDAVAQVRSEHEVANGLGLDVEWAEALADPVVAPAAVILPDQAQVDPVGLVHALAEEVRRHGGVIHEHQRVVDISLREPWRVEFETGVRLRAGQVVVATGSPIVDRGLHFARVAPARSYVIALKDAQIPPAMYLSVGAATRSLRDVPEHDLVLVGGAGHSTGRVGSERAQLAQLRSWAQAVFPDATQTHAWGAQDYSPYDGVPLVGRIPGSRGLFTATGFDKWGMTGAAAAAEQLAAEVLGQPAPSYGHTWTLLSAGRLARLNASIVVEGLRHPRALGRCTHLRGPLVRNDLEGSWDCPWHGSRYGSDGEILDGPACRRLTSLPD